MNRIDLKQAAQLLRDADSILVTTHASPDGDAIGSALALYHLLKTIGKENVTLTCNDPVPRMYHWLQQSDRFVLPGAVTQKHTLGVVTDVAQFARCGKVEPHLRNCDKVLVLDHHLEPNPCGDYHFIDATYASASGLIFDLYDAADIPFTREIAECIYVGLATDTGGFRYGNTNANAHRRASRLLEAGINVTEISSRVFETITLPKIELLQRILQRLTITAEGRVAHTWLKQADMDETKAAPEDIEGLVNYARNIEGVKVGMMFREVDGGKKVKLSMRSGDGFNSAKTLQAFGGGGHIGAAGATFEPPLQDAIEKVLKAVHQTLGDA